MVLGDTEGILGMKRMEKALNQLEAARLPPQVAQRRLLRLPQGRRLGRLDVASKYVPAAGHPPGRRRRQLRQDRALVLRRPDGALRPAGRFLVLFLVGFELKGWPRAAALVLGIAVVGGAGPDGRDPAPLRQGDRLLRRRRPVRLLGHPRLMTPSMTTVPSVRVPRTRTGSPARRRSTGRRRLRRGA